MIKTESFGRIAREQRERLGWSLQTVSELCNMSIRGYNKIELGTSNPKLSTVLTIIHVLNLSPIILNECLPDAQ